jgi:hypothetical protein
MKSEFYIVNLIQSDADACRKVARHLGLDSSLEPREVIGELSRRNVFWAQSESVFEELRDILDSRHTGSQSLSDQDLRLLFHAESQMLMGKLLKCSPGESVQTLFPADDLAGILEDLDIRRSSDATSMWDDSEFLLSLILDKKAKLQAAGITDLFGELNWRLRPNTHHDLAHQLKCDEEDTLEELVRYLKGVASPSGRAPSLAGGVEYDIIAISKLRNYLHDFRERFLREAILEGGKAQARLPGHRTPGLLAGLIEYCVSGNFKTGLNSLLSSKQFLRERVTRKVTDSSAATGVLQAMIVPLEQPAPLPASAPEGAPAGAQKVRVEIQYKSSANAMPLTILATDELTRDEAGQVENNMQKSCDKLSPIGANLYERILNTPLPIFSRWRRTLYAIMKSARSDDELDDSFVQCFVLSGVSFDAASIVPGLRPPQTQTAVGTANVRVEFPKGASEIANVLEEEYRKQGRNVNRVGSAARRSG